MMKILLIGVGGAIGAILRYVCAGWGQRLTDSALPVGTLGVNVLGCFLLGGLAAWFAGPQLVREEYRVAIMVGLLGGFTTFSTYALETLTLAKAGALQHAVLNPGLQQRPGPRRGVDRIPPRPEVGGCVRP